MSATALQVTAPADADAATERARRARRDRMLFARRAAGDRHARDELIMRFLPLARSLARRYEHSAESLEDLVQVASVALVRAVDGFEVSRGYAFSSYAVPSIVGELKRHFRDRSWAIRPPRELQELTLAVERAASRLSARLDRAPTVAELAIATGRSDEQILEALQAGAGRSTLSLEAPASARSADALQDTLGDDDGGYARAEDRAFVDRLTRHLPARSREVLRLRFEEDLTQAEIGLLLGISQMHVSRIVRQALEHMRRVGEHCPVAI